MLTSALLLLGLLVTTAWLHSSLYIMIKKQPTLSNWAKILCLCFPFLNQQILTISCQVNWITSMHHLTHDVICLCQANNTDRNFACLCFAKQKQLGKITKTSALAPRSSPHFDEWFESYVEEEMSASSLGWYSLGQSIISPKSIVALSTVDPSRIVSRQGGPCIFSPAAISRGLLVHGLRQRKGKFSPFGTGWKADTLTGLRPRGPARLRTCG